MLPVIFLWRVLHKLYEPCRHNRREPHSDNNAVIAADTEGWEEKVMGQVTVPLAKSTDLPAKKCQAAVLETRWEVTQQEMSGMAEIGHKNKVCAGDLQCGGISHLRGNGNAYLLDSNALLPFQRTKPL